MKIVRPEQMAWNPAPPDNFTGRVWFGPIAPPSAPEDLSVLGVLFEPGARSHWHRHPEGQVLVVISGAGRVGTEAGELVEIGAGDAVVTPPQELHWHGAGPTNFMFHLSLTTGGPTQWTGQAVTDSEYSKS